MHLVERSYHGRYCAGQWKDIESLNFILKSLGHDFEFIEFERDKIEQVVATCSDRKATDVIVYYSFWPELLHRLRSELPDLKLYVRTVNAEAMQNWQRSEISLFPSYSNIRQVYGSIRLAWRDSQCKKYADAMLGISEWDNRNYWLRLPGKSRVYDVPYCSPWPEYRHGIAPKLWVDRSNQIICLAGGRDPIGKSMVQGFKTMADNLQIQGEFDNWEFLLSPGIIRTDVGDALSCNVVRMNLLDEPWDMLCSVKALAVLTPLGFGSKTTIIDALAAGCHVFVHPVLARRLPEYVRDLCIEYDPIDNTDHTSLHYRLSRQPEQHGINDTIKDQVREVFHDIFKARRE